MITRLILELSKVRNEYTNLKLWLEQKEIVEYYAWKQENEKDRTAMDKIIAKLKLEDDEWLNKDEEVLKLKNKYDLLNDAKNTVLKLLDRKEFEKEEIEQFIENILEGIEND